MKKAVFLACLVFCLANSKAVFADDGIAVEKYWGTATDESGKMVYREKHTTYYENGRIKRSVTKYLDPEGREIAMMDSNYERSVAMPTYIFKDYRRDYEEGLRYRNGKYYIFNRDPGRGEEERVLKDTSNVYSCQGWHYYVVENMNELKRDASFALKLIFPKKLKAYPFRIEKTDASADKMNVRVRFDNLAISWLLPQLDLVYNTENRKLLRFEGVSNIFDANDELQKVRIIYSE